jgi:hypothetical protein
MSTLIRRAQVSGIASFEASSDQHQITVVAYPDKCSVAVLAAPLQTIVADALIDPADARALGQFLLHEYPKQEIN